MSVNLYFIKLYSFVSKNNTNFSIIITGYNRKEYIYKAFLSAFRQNYPRDNFEIIIVSNFVNEEISEISRMNPDFIKIILSHKPGYGCKLKEGINIASGEYICFLDDDDMFTENKLSLLNNILSKENNIGIIKNYCNLIDSTDNSIVMKSNTNDILALAEPLNYYNIKHKNEDGYSIIKICQKRFADFIRAFSNTSSLTVLKSIIDKYLDELCQIMIGPEDFLLTVAMIENKKCIIAENKLTRYRVHNNNNSTHQDIGSQFYFFLNLSADFRISANLANNTDYKTSLRVISGRLYMVSIYKYCKLNGSFKALKFFKKKELILSIGYAVFGQPELHTFKLSIAMLKSILIRLLKSHGS